jgi:hypothetical protein
MFTLSIEHRITDFATWKVGFDRFAAAREQAGVLSQRIRRPAGDEHYLVIELDFSSREQAEAFRQFLHNVVWVNRAASPALAGGAQARVLEPVAAGG